LLADVAGDAAAAGQHGGAPLLRDLMLTVGPAASGMILGSRQRLLACLRAGDPDGAAREMREHLHVLHYMERLARHPEVSRR
jgi:DNA-binding FadR family transcriptional regulator